MVELARVEARVAELRLRVMGTAADVADGVRCRRRRGVGGRGDPGCGSRTPAPTWLLAIGSRPPLRPTSRAALREGRANLAQARVIVQALDALPDDVTPEMLDLAEQHPVTDAEHRSAPRSCAGSGAGSSRSSPRRSPRPPKPAAWPTSRPRPTARPGSTSAGSATAPPGSAGCSPTRSPTASRPTSKPSPTPASNRAAPRATDATEAAEPTEEPETESQRRPVTRSSGSRSRGASVRRSCPPRGLRPPPPPAARRRRDHRGHHHPSTSLLADLGTADLLVGGHIPGDSPTDATITAAQARRLACTANILPAVLGATPRSSTSAAPAASSAPPNAKPCGSATATAEPRAATSPRPGAKPTTGTPGPTAATPTSPTASSSAPTTTTAPTTPPTRPNDYPTATSASTGAPSVLLMTRSSGRPHRSVRVRRVHRPACATTTSPTRSGRPRSGLPSVG